MINSEIFFCSFISRILYSTTIEGPQIVNLDSLFPAYYIFNVLLYILQVLHLFWFYIICRVAYKSVMSGKVDKDERSDASDSESDSENKAKQN
jgi:hypothetical protein